jgi:predicted TIM-barrel fold metal-dependent hydrolase
MRIVDAHHHLWDPIANPHPWLRDEPPPAFRYGDTRPLRRRFLPEEYDAATAGWDVAASVTMEGEWDPADPTGEAVWMQALARRTGRPAAHAAQAWLDRDDLDAVLEIYAGLPLVRSVRHKPRATAAPGQGRGGLPDPAFRRGFARLAGTGLLFELQTPWWHLDEAADLAAVAPEVTIVLNHAGLPGDRSEEGLAGWRAAMRGFAGLPNALVKISGLGLPDRPWRIEDNRDLIRFVVDVFGPERAMFASNYPVDGLCGSFATIYRGFDAATADRAERDRCALFHDTAARAYGLAVERDEDGDGRQTPGGAHRPGSDGGGNGAAPDGGRASHDGARPPPPRGGGRAADRGCVRGA